MGDIDYHYRDDGRPRHGSPEDRGSADRYYGRRYDPHWHCEVRDEFGRFLRTERIESDGMSVSEIAAYNVGFHKETDRKDWGDGPVQDWSPHHETTCLEEVV
jgi:hypothetical protein